MLELLSRPLIIVFRFGIEVDEALRVGSSGFLGESDAGEAELQTHSEGFRGKFYYLPERMYDLFSKDFTL